MSRKRIDFTPLTNAERARRWRDRHSQKPPNWPRLILWLNADKPVPDDVWDAIRKRLKLTPRPITFQLVEPVKQPVRKIPIIVATEDEATSAEPESQRKP